MFYLICDWINGFVERSFIYKQTFICHTYSYEASYTTCGTYKLEKQKQKKHFQHQSFQFFFDFWFVLFLYINPQNCLKPKKQKKIFRFPRFRWFCYVNEGGYWAPC